MDKRDGWFGLGGENELKQPDETSADSAEGRDKKSREADEQKRAKEEKEQKDKEAAEKAEQEEAVKKKKEKARKEQAKKDEEAEQHEARQQRRRQSVEKSQRLIRKLGNDEYRELSPLETIQLVVAERITRLGAQLDGDELISDIDAQAIERQLDFFSLLSDKLENPEQEIPPQIDEVYQQIIEATSQASDEVEVEPDEPEEDTPKDPFASLAELFDLSDEPEDDTPSSSEQYVRVDYDSGGDAAPTTPDVASPLRSRPSSAPEFDPTPSSEQAEDDAAEDETKRAKQAATVALVISAFAYVRRKRRQKKVDGAPRVGGGVGVSASDASPRPEPDSSTSDSAPSRAAGRRGFAAQSLSSHALHGYRAAATQVEAVSASDEPIHSHNPAPTKQIFEHRLPSPPHVIRQAESIASIAPENSNIPAVPRVSDFERIPAVESPRMTLPDTPIEAWSLGDMLRAAEGISLGNGRYLRQAFDRGEIDRAGLVKVLKDWKKGKNYAAVFDSQRAALARRRAESREYLRDDRKPATQATTAPSDEASNTDDNTHDASESAAPHASDTPTFDTPTTPPSPSDKQENESPVEPPEPSRISKILLSIAIASTFALGGIIVYLLQLN